MRPSNVVHICKTAITEELHCLDRNIQKIHVELDDILKTLALQHETNEAFKAQFERLSRLRSLKKE